MHAPLVVLDLIGSDADKLLQNQLTCDIHEVTDEQARFTSICDLKGRVISTLLVARIKPDHLALIVPKSLQGVLEQHLDKYLRFSRSKLTASKYQVTSRAQRIGNAFSVVHSDSGVVIQHPSEKICWVLSEDQPTLPDEFIEHDIQAGLVWLTPSTSESFLPQVLGLEHHGGISYNKGCYLGQEVIARVHFLGKPKQKLAIVHFGDIIPEQTVSLKDEGGKSHGSLTIVNQHQALAIISTSAPTKLFVDGTNIEAAWSFINEPKL